MMAPGRIAPPNGGLLSHWLAHVSGAVWPSNARLLVVVAAVIVVVCVVLGLDNSR